MHVQHLNDIDISTSLHIETQKKLNTAKAIQMVEAKYGYTYYGKSFLNLNKTMRNTKPAC